MKYIINVLVTALIGSALSDTRIAQTKPTNPTTPAAPASIEKKTESASSNAQASVLTGRVTSVNAKAGKVTVKANDKEISLTTDSKSTKTALGKLKVGDMAKVFAKGGEVIAISPVKADSNAKPPK